MKFLLIVSFSFLVACSIEPSKSIYVDLYYHTVFSGDSIMAAMPTDHFSNSTNYGIPGGNIWTYDYFYSSITNVTGDTVVYWVGINSLSISNYSVESAIGNYQNMLDYGRRNFKHIYCISVLYINRPMFLTNIGEIKMYLYATNSKIDALNNYIKSLPDVTFIDVRPLLCTNLNGTNELIAKYSKDGIHLNDEGYALIKETIASNQF